MNTIPYHHRWPAEGSARQHCQEKVVEDPIFGSGALHLSSARILKIGFKEDVCRCRKCMQVSAKVGAVV